jgi:hypothetical protein
MTRFTSAYSSFLIRLDEVEVLCNIAFTKERENPVKHRKEINAHCRGSIVLLSGHLEGFIKELGEIALDSMHQKCVNRNRIASSRLYYHISKNILTEVKDTSDPDKIADKIFNFIETDIAFWSKDGPFPEPIPVERFNKGFSNPAFEHICNYFSRFGYTKYRNELGHILKAIFQPTINMVDHLVAIRNEIAHGNPTASKTPAEVKEMVEIIKRFCRITDSIFAAWWKSQYCSIR